MHGSHVLHDYASISHARGALTTGESMNAVLRLFSLAIALLLSVATFANQPGTLANTTVLPGYSVEILRTSLQNNAGFELQDARMTDDGIACIVYRVHNERGGVSRALAVVQGEKVLVSTSRSRSFERAWNSKCAGKD